MQQGASLPHPPGIPVGLLVDAGEPPVLRVVRVSAPVDHAEGRGQGVYAESPPGVGSPGSGYAVVGRCPTPRGLQSVGLPPDDVASGLLQTRRRSYGPRSG